MIQDIVSLLSFAVSNGIGMAGFMFDKTGMWPLVFAGISVVLITRFILGPILGFTGSGASDVVSHARSDFSKARNKRNYDKRVEQAKQYKKG